MVQRGDDLHMHTSLQGGKGYERDVLDTHPTLMSLSLQPALERACLEAEAVMHGYFSPSDLLLRLFRWRMGLMVQA